MNKLLTMDYVEGINSHRQLWNLLDDQEASLTKYKARILSNLQPDFFDSSVDWESVRFHYAFFHGLQYEQYDAGSDPFWDAGSEFRRQVRGDIEDARDPRELANVLYGFLLSLRDGGRAKGRRALRDLVGVIEAASAVTPSVGVRIEKVDGTYLFTPYGASMLDNDVVLANLTWLASFPSARAAFVNAIRARLSGDLSRYRNLLDDLRVAMEETVRGVLGNNRSLENQKLELVKWLKARGVHQQTVNLYVGLLFGGYRVFQNDAVKHGSDWTEKEVEFYIYLTGTFIRLLVTLSGDEPTA